MFSKFRHKIGRFHADESAATATEYIILLILVACVIIAIVQMYGRTVSAKYKVATDAVDKEVSY